MFTHALPNACKGVYQKKKKQPSRTGIGAVVASAVLWADMSFSGRYLLLPLPSASPHICRIFAVWDQYTIADLHISAGCFPETASDVSVKKITPPDWVGNSSLLSSRKASYCPLPLREALRRLQPSEQHAFQ